MLFRCCQSIGFSQPEPEFASAATLQFTRIETMRKTFHAALTDEIKLDGNLFSFASTFKVYFSRWGYLSGQRCARFIYLLLNGKAGKPQINWLG